MRQVKIFFSLLFLMVGINAFALERATIIVAKDGSGNFTKINDAIRSVPETNSSNVTILVKNGTYNEHVIIDRSFITLVGESKENTKIELTLNRATWYSTHKLTGVGSTNQGSGVIDIGVSSVDTMTTVKVSNIVIANMSVTNLYNDKNAYTHAIRGEATATKIWVVYCNVWGGGADTLALWNKTEGVYYHCNNNYKGSIDAVCPRGWCYDINSEYQEIYASAPIWHEGATGSGQRFVVRGAYIDAWKDPNNKNKQNLFKLLNGQLDAIFYLLDCNTTTWCEKIGGNYKAAYFYNFHTIGGDQTWHKDNLSSTNQRDITGEWTFAGNWNPENIMPSVLPFPAIPQPWDKAYDLANTITLKWIGARNAISHNLYFGTTTNPSQVLANTSAREYAAGTLAKGQYYWRVEAVLEDNSVVSSPVWSFAVGQAYTPTAIAPADASTNQISAVNNLDKSITLEFTLPENQSAKLDVIDIKGNTVYQNILFEEKNCITLSLPTGVYVALLKKGNQTETKKFIIP